MHKINSSSSALGLLKIIFKILSKKERLGLLRLLILNTFLGLLDVFSIASVIPVLNLFSDEKNAILLKNQLKDILFFSWVGNIEVQNLIIFISISAVFLVILASTYKIFITYQMNEYVHNVRSNLSVRILKNYLRKDYEESTIKNSAEVSKVILSEVDQFVIRVFRPITIMLSSTIVLIIILIFLLLASTAGALFFILGVLSFYLGIYSFIKKKATRSGVITSNSSKYRFKTAIEAFDSLKDIKIYKGERFFMLRHEKASLNFSRALSYYETLEASPKFLLEMIAFSILILMTIIINSNANIFGPISGVTLLGTFAFAAFKAQPPLTAVFHGLSGLKYGTKNIETIWNELIVRNKSFDQERSSESFKTKEAEIIFKNVSFSHEDKGRSKSVLENLSFKIKKNSLTVITGVSGIGKSTLLDLIVGLITPTSGQIFVGSFDNRFEQKKISYMHQNSSFFDSTIAKNVAFGVKESEIDFVKLKDSLVKAKFWSYVEKSEKGIYTKIGEKGCKLSGGQKQRLAFARALYFDSEILLLDEPCSALDAHTESEIYQEIIKLSRIKTIVMVTHKLSNLPDKTVIFKMKNKKIIEVTNGL